VHALARFEAIAPGEMAMSVITYGELLYGVIKSADSARAISILNRIQDRVPALALPPNAAEAYAHIRTALERTGNVIGANDLWIAAHALASDLTLVSNNEREFKRVKDLKIENWAK
jgi:tRNA(fMet)-specific endonuclease VapC